LFIDKEFKEKKQKREQNKKGDGSIFFEPKIKKRKNNNRTVPFFQRNSR